jgi:hypothetical protein
MADTPYIRLARPRRRSGFAFISTRTGLWLGSDHLLSVDSTRFTEEYKRFYFRDIQVITIRRNKRLSAGNTVMALLFIVWTGSLISAISAPGGADSYVLWWFAGALLWLVIPLLVNNILGPGCIVDIRTAVQTEELPALNRLRRARKVMERIRPLIVAAQGALDAEQVTARLREIPEPSAAPVAAAAAARSSVVTSPLNLSTHPADDAH